VATPGAEEAAALLLVMMLGGTLPVPLYVFYEKQMGFGPLGVTVVFAAYVAGTLFALVVLGDLSDHIGRKKVLAIAVACAAVSTALFLAASGLAASGIGVLIVARVVSGMAAGLATGTATAALTELQPRGDHRAAAVTASGSNMTGLGLGPLLAGLFAEYVAMPTRSVFWAYLGVCALTVAALPLFSNLVPTFLHGTLGVHNLALIGGASFLIFIIAAISQAASARMPSRRSVSAGLPLLLVCLAALESALFAKALWVFVVATVAGGIAVGFVFRGGLSELNRLADPSHRAAVVSAFFVAAYVGLGLPAVLTGLISLAVGPIDASAYVSGLAAAVVVVAFAMVRRTFGVTSAPRPPTAPSDSWCCPAEPVGAGG
jgi:predicted MFS family arabinose efflux permease